MRVRGAAGRRRWIGDSVVMGESKARMWKSRLIRYTFA